MPRFETQKKVDGMVELKENDGTSISAAVSPESFNEKGE